MASCNLLSLRRSTLRNATFFRKIWKISLNTITPKNKQGILFKNFTHKSHSLKIIFEIIKKVKRASFNISVGVNASEIINNDLKIYRNLYRNIKFYPQNKSRDNLS